MLGFFVTKCGVRVIHMGLNRFKYKLPQPRDRHNSCQCSVPDCCTNAPSEGDCITGYNAPYCYRLATEKGE